MFEYKWDANDYEKHSASQRIWAKELIEKLSLKGTEIVLDVGCGDGKVTAEIARILNNGSVVGIDISNSMIKFAEKRYSKQLFPNLTFKEMDASNITMAESFDVVFSNAALHWIKNHKPVIKGIYNALKPKGKILLQMGGKGNAHYILSTLYEIISSSRWAPYFSDFEFPYGFFGVEEYRTLLIENRFKINRLELIPKDMIHNKKSDFIGWIRTTWLPYTAKVPAAKRDIFINEIVSRYIEKNSLDKDGKIHVAMARLEVEAVKNT
jgi:trans-aconitate methyltransferase